MFEDEYEQNSSEKEKRPVSNKDAITQSSAVKAAIFVFGLMVCVIIVYVLIFAGGENPGNASPTPNNTATSGSVTPDPNATETPDQTLEPTPTETPFSYQRGDENEKIRELQQLLIDKKYLAADTELSNTFGPKTEEAVKLFQSDNGLEQTGIVDNNLFNMLKNAPEREEAFTLQRGTTSDKVKELQDLLIEKKYLDLGGEPSTTYFGAQTEAAVKLFQQTNGITVTGIVNNTLFNIIKNAPEYSPPAAT